MRVFYLFVLSCVFPTLTLAIWCLECSHSNFPGDIEMGVPNDNSCKMISLRSSIKFVIECKKETVFPWMDMLKKHHQNVTYYTSSLTAVEGKQTGFACYDTIHTDGEYDFALRGCALASEDSWQYISDSTGYLLRSSLCNSLGCNIYS